MADNLCTLIIMFFCFSVAGWLIEVTLKYIEMHRFINRGFLIGPYCPVYGFGVVAVSVIVGGVFGKDKSAAEIFLFGMLLCGVIEYFTGWYMEKLFHARWWDYSDKPMNLHGRIWIGNLILFGLACVIIVKFVAPGFFELAARVPLTGKRIMCLFITAIMATDYVLSHQLMSKITNAIEAQKGDNTEEISLKIHQMLREKNVLLRRIHDAFQNMQVRPKTIMDEYKKALKEFKSVKRSSRRLIRDAEKAWRKGLKHVDYEKIGRDAYDRLKAAREKFNGIQNKFKISNRFGDK